MLLPLEPRFRQRVALEREHLALKPGLSGPKPTPEPGSLAWQSEHILIHSDGTPSHNAINGWWPEWRECRSYFEDESNNEFDSIMDPDYNVTADPLAKAQCMRDMFEE